MKDNKLRMDSYMAEAIADAELAQEVGAQPEETNISNDGAQMAEYVNKKKEGK